MVLVSEPCPRESNEHRSQQRKERERTLESQPQSVVLARLPVGNSRNRPSDSLACAVAGIAHINRGSTGDSVGMPVGNAVRRDV